MALKDNVLSLDANQVIEINGKLKTKNSEWAIYPSTSYGGGYAGDLDGMATEIDDNGENLHNDLIDLGLELGIRNPC